MSYNNNFVYENKLRSRGSRVDFSGFIERICEKRMRYLIKNGRRIKLLPRAKCPEEELFCGRCGERFGGDQRRKACFEVCGHEACLGCLFKMTGGCEECGEERSTGAIEGTLGEGETPPQVLVLSSVLRQSSEEDGFPEIKRLSLSQLPVLECANEPPTYEVDEEEEQRCGGNEEQVVEQENIEQDIPCIDLAAEEYISVIDLSSDDDDDEVFSKSMENCSRITVPATKYQLTAIQRIQLELAKMGDKANSSFFLGTPPSTSEGEAVPQKSLSKRRKTQRISLGSNESKEVVTPSQTKVISEVSEEPSKARIFIRKRRKKPNPSPPQPSPEKNFPCFHCSEVFLEKTRLADHLREAHSDKRPYTCDLCGWSFAQKNKLALHRITHTIDRPHKCQQCEATFNRKYSLERHIRIRHLKAPRLSEAAENKPCQRKPALCPYCQERFENKDQLGVHLQQKHQEKRPFLCIQCGWPFSRRKHLVAHMKTHSQDRPYSCSICEDASFNRRFSLERHMEHVHGIRIRLSPEETPVGEEYCPECQSLFGSVDCQKVAYSVCGHVICMDCVKRAEELGCGQCTTESAAKEGTVEEMEESVKSTVQAPDAGEVIEEQESTMEKENELKKLTKAKSTKGKRKKSYKFNYSNGKFPEKPDLGIHRQYIHRDL